MIRLLILILSVFNIISTEKITYIAVNSDGNIWIYFNSQYKSSVRIKDQVAKGLNINT